MTTDPIKPTWQARAKAVHLYHTDRLREDITWSLRDTAKALGRSLGSVSSDLQLAEFLRSYEDELSRFKNYVDALAWIKQKKDQLRRRG